MLRKSDVIQTTECYEELLNEVQSEREEAEKGLSHLLAMERELKMRIAGILTG